MRSPKESKPKSSMKGAGNERLSANKKQSDTDKDMSAGGESPAGKKDSGGKTRGDVARALRTVYDSTLEEDVPPEFLDLLGKLS